jgi:glutathione S-transferase
MMACSLINYLEQLQPNPLTIPANGPAARSKLDWARAFGDNKYSKRVQLIHYRQISKGELRI